ncbi:MAG TPA: thioredoxin domain-containing protein [Polyangiaceae bacterium]|nr:thioredoxin domain-containing protein [Polyangiaceae bacterium]
MNKGTAIVGFFISFLAGMFLMWGMDKRGGSDISAEGSTASGSAVPDQSAASVPVTSKDPQWGKATAPVTIVEISDFQCPFCSRVEPTIEQIRQKYGPDKVRIVWKNNPLPFHKNARPTHEAAMTVFALGGNDAFWKFHKSAFSNQQALSDENYEKWAKEAGVDVAKFKAAYAAKKYAAKVDEDLAMAKKVGASGTPAFRINGVTVSGAQPIDKFTEVIDAQLAEAKKLVASGTKPSDVYVTLTNKNQQAAPANDAKKPAPDAEEEDKSVWKVLVQDDDPVRGPKDALVTMIIFSDFQCPFCKRVEDTLKQVAAAYPQDVRFVWKDNPLPFHPRAKPAATLARFVYKAKGEKAFWDAHDAIFESNPKLEDDDLKGIAEKLGVKWDDVKAAIDNNKFADKIDGSVELANDVQARGTPHFFINGVRLSGAQPIDAFKKSIDEQLAKAKAIVAKGVPKAKVYDELMKDAKGPPPPEKKEIAAADSTCPVKGGKNAKVTITIFSDFQCPFCKRVEPTLAELEKEYGDKIKFVWRNMPLPFHADAPLAGQAAMEAFAQKGNAGFWKMHDKLFEVQGTAEDAIKRPGLEKAAQELGLNMDKFKAALDSNAHKAKLDADSKIGNDAGINGTPAFVINGYYLSGAQPSAAFKKLINRALKEAGGG